MAVDTRSKRASAVHIGSPWRGIWPKPDASMDATDRAQTVFLYSGFLTGFVEPEQPGDMDIGNYAGALARLRANARRTRGSRRWGYFDPKRWGPGSVGGDDQTP